MGSFDKHNFGSLVKRSKSTPFSISGKSSSGPGQILCRVEDIILDETHPDYNSNIGPSQIGRIRASVVGSNYKISQKIIPADPESSNLKHYPKIGEHVFVKKVFAPNTAADKWVYDPTPIALFNNAPNSNEYPSQTTNLTPPSQRVDYTQAENGAYSVADPDFQANEVTSNPNQPIVHPLMPFYGDVLYEGRNGQSIRFGGTSKSNSQWKNNWSTSGNEGDPITILRNGQPKNLPLLGWIPITENINEDLSSIYLTSTQKIPITTVKEDFISYSTPPQSPSQYTSPQVLFNSDRIILNAKNDSILLSGQKSVGLFSNESINLESKQIYVDGTDIRLGSKTADEPILLGNKTVDTLSQILTQLIGICDLLSVSKIYPGGVPIPDAPLNAMASNASSAFQQIQNKLNSLKSNISKTK